MIRSSYLILLASLVCSLQLLSYRSVNTHNAQNDITIVDINDQLSANLCELSEYLYDHFIDQNGDRLSIQVYTVDAIEHPLINELVILLEELGVNKDQMEVEYWVLNAPNPYLVITIPAFQDVE